MLSTLNQAISALLETAPTRHHSPIENKASTNQWILESDIIYLLNTLKIQTDTALGQITLENIDRKQLSSSIAHIESLLTEQPSDHPAPIVITVCGITREASEQGTRIRAIPKAAGLRYFPNAPINSDAYFYKDNVALDNLPSNLFSDRQAHHAYSLDKLSLNAFITLLEQHNAQMPLSLYLRSENFDETFTAHEQKIIEALSQSMNHV